MGGPVSGANGSEAAWWKSGTVYQIYPRSFQDTDGDGVGDLRGITARLDYLAWLGVDAVWISPFYRSPMADFGYDVADYCAVDPLFGTLEDFDALIAEAHRRKLRVILDFVPNHSSIAHPWFTESRASRASRKRDWYIWRDPAPDGGPPNNWLSNFGGPAWTRDPATGQYYYHAFLPEQPDLNWRNPEVRAAMHDALRFWLARGVDGFRVDVIWHLIKDKGFRDNPHNPGFQPHQAGINRFQQVYSCDRPEVLDVIAGMRAVLREYGERVLIGEIYLPIERLVAYYGPGLTGADLPFNFQLIQTPWRADAVAALVVDAQQVVLCQADAADGCAAVDSAVWALPVVAEQEGGQFGAALLGGVVGPGVRPFAQGGLDEALDLAVGPRRVGSRALVADVEAPQGLGVALGFEGWPVVGHDALDTDTVAAEEPQGVEEEGEAGGPGLVGQDLGVGQPRMVVDGQVQELPADAAA
ncbi:hypothetical protein J2W80_001857 [Methylorubrum extorquens]|nr:hypothetical protein [Methylorubrum extorquens]MCP1590609.1 hypothetical protein [Methylorubrum extorquens]